MNLFTCYSLSSAAQLFYKERHAYVIVSLVT
jgi:hypothetical protein